MTRTLVKFALAAATAAGLLSSIPHALAGPPLLCWPYDIGNARSLPMGGTHWKEIKSGYDASRVEADTLALLGPQTPVLVRMETLRRAAVYTMSDEAASLRLLDRLRSRVTQRGTGAAEALALFDAGYMIETYKETPWGWKPKSSVSSLDGYGMVVSAIAKRGGDPEMEFAAAMMSFDDPTRHKTDRERQTAHLNAAMAHAEEGSLLAKNLVLHAELFGRDGKSFADLKSRAKK